MKPIEAGCKAMMINSKAGNNGRVVTPIKFLGDDTRHPLPNVWQLAEELPAVYTHGIFRNQKTTSNLAAESQLMRIDGGEFEDEELHTTIKEKI